MHKDNAFESFSKFKGRNDHIVSTNKLFSALKDYLENHKEWKISNEVKRLKGVGFIYGENKIQRVWVLKRKVIRN